MCEGGRGEGAIRIIGQGDVWKRLSGEKVHLVWSLVLRVRLSDEALSCYLVVRVNLIVVSKAWKLLTCSFDTGQEARIAARSSGTASTGLVTSIVYVLLHHAVSL